jgi:hypothetical protein
MDERDWRIPIAARSKSKVTSLPLRHADTPTRGWGNDAKHISGFTLGNLLKGLRVSVDSVRAFLPPDYCAPAFHGGFRCFPKRRNTRTEVTEFTEGLAETSRAFGPDTWR